MLNRWRDLFAALGEAALDLFDAEVAELESDFGRSGRQLRKIGIAFAVAGGLAFYATGAVALLLVVLLDGIWPLWAASLAVALLLLLGTGLAVALGVRWLNRLESPGTTVRRRIRSFVDWWESEVAAGDVAEVEGVPDREEQP